MNFEQFCVKFAFVVAEDLIFISNITEAEIDQSIRSIIDTMKQYNCFLIKITLIDKLNKEVLMDLLFMNRIKS